tara:strand:- start:595 stop:1077 length:483 start_codon:yes stop_codon:yes gene_type:complete
MHEAMVIRKIDEMMELLDIVSAAISDRPDEKALKYTKERITHFTKLLSAYVGIEVEMIHSMRVDAIFQSFYSLKEKFDAFIKNNFQEGREWYTAALIVSEADNALDESTLAAHTVRECLKSGMAPWLALCATNSVLEKDIVTLKESKSAYDALVKSGKIK